LKKDTKQHTDGWDVTSKAWTHVEGGFGVTFNDVTEDFTFYITTSHFVAWLGSFSLVPHRP
jgi:hypothetical protein